MISPSTDTELFLTLCITVLQLYIDYRNEIEFIEKQIDHLKDSYYKTLANSLWTIDKPQVENILNGMLMFQDIQYLEVKIEKKHGLY